MSLARSGVSPPVRRFCTGKLTHAARQCLNHGRAQDKRGKSLYVAR